jgi:hypothetical protein
LPADRAIRCEQSRRVEAAQEGRLHAEQARERRRIMLAVMCTVGAW